MDDLLSITNYFKKHKATKAYKEHNGKVHSVGWSCDGKRLASGSFDKTVCISILDSNAGKLVKEHLYQGHGGSVDQLSWHSRDPYLLSTASGDKSVRIWDARARKCVANISTKGENINISWSPNGDTIAVGNKEDLISFIDTKTFKIVKEESFRFEVNEIAWNKDNTLFYITNGFGYIYIYSYPEVKFLYSLKAHPSACICIEFDPTGNYFAVGAADASVSLWDANELACLRTFTSLEWPVRTVSFSYDGKLLASASEDSLIDISHVETGKRITTIPVEAATFTVAWHPKKYLLAYACDDKASSSDRDRSSSSSSSKSDAGTLKLFGFRSESDSHTSKSD